MRRLLLIGGTALLGAGCGGPSAGEVIAETRDKLDTIRSGDLSMRLVSTPAGNPAGRVGFAVEGPFGLARGSALPVARVRYTQIAGPREGAVTIVSTGREAFVEVGREAYELGPRQTRDLRGAGGASGPGGALGGLRVDRWMREPALSDGGTVAGVETDLVRSDLEVVPAVNDLLKLTGDKAAVLEGREARPLEAAAEEATLAVWTGKNDRLLRRLELRAGFGVAVPKDLQEALGRVAGADVRFGLSVKDPNEPVRITAPRGARRYAELPRG